MKFIEIFNILKQKPFFRFIYVITFGLVISLIYIFLVILTSIWNFFIGYPPRILPKFLEPISEFLDPYFFSWEDVGDLLNLRLLKNWILNKERK